MSVSEKSDVSKIEGIGEKTSKVLNDEGISQAKDLLEYYPKNHIHYEKTSTLGAKPGKHVILTGQISKPFSKKTNYTSTQTSNLKDEMGSITLRWFNQPYLARSINLNQKYQVKGTVEEFRGQRQIVSPEISTKVEHTSSLLRPIYKRTKSLSSSWFERMIKKALQSVKVKETLQEEILSNHDLLGRKEALSLIHFPRDYDQVEKARRRIEFEELYTLQLSSLKRKSDKRSKSYKMEYKENDINKLIKSLPYKLTESQLQSIKEVLEGTKNEYSTNRLLSGDVGSGKTVVAVAAAYNTFLNGYKTAVLAPTQVLAEQLFSNFKDLLEEKGVKISLHTGQEKTSKNFDIIVGTHAVLNLEKIDQLAMAIIDEQHKFGVEQRESFAKQDVSPHKLTMSATPIPRTLARSLTSYLDISHLSELPKDRKEVKTYLTPEEKRKDAYSWIKKHISENGYQTFVVVPLVEDSDKEKMKNVKSAESHLKELKKEFKGLKVELLHGKMSQEEKLETIHKFKDKKINILVATTVIEVGIDIPEANIIVIESAERFGLAQLHQLRGRVGRRDKQGYCLLFTESTSPRAQKRLKYFESHTDGQKLALYDLKSRGPGELWGTEQHGYFNLKLASIFDTELVEETYKAALSTLEKSNA